MTHGKSILVVEDEAITALEIQSCLTRLGYRVSAIAASGEQAILNALQSSPDLVLMDITLKGKQDGIVTAKHLHDRLNVPVIYLTAFADDTTLQHAMQAQPYGYIVKPFQEQELRTTIETAIYKHQIDNVLRDRDQWYASLLTSLSDAIITTDRECRITLMNPVAEVLTGWNFSKAKGKYIGEVFAMSEKGSSSTSTSLVPTVIRNNHPQRMEGVLRGATPEDLGIWVTASASPIVTTEGTIKGVALVFQDISERKQAEEQLRQTEAKIRQLQKMEAIGTLAGGIAHDFNNILTAILGFTQLALRKVTNPSPIQDNLQMILTGAHRAKDLVQQILTFSRQNEKEHCPTDLQSLLIESIKLLRATLPATIDLKQELSQGLGTVLADPTQLQQVIMNLCTNAKQAMGETGGILEITLHAIEVEPHLAIEHPPLKAGPHMRLRVRDTGPGIKPEVLPRIFDPFFTTKQVGKGTGIGLAFAHSIIASHGGTISVESELGRGTTFEVLLPRIEQEPILTNASPPLENHAGKGRILFIDDEIPLAKLGEEILKGLGYDVTSYTNSLEALEVFQNDASQFDVVITDQTMPNMSGEQLMTELRRIRKDIPIILCTGFMTAQNREVAKNLGVRAVLAKPWSTQDIGAALKQILKQEK